MTPALNGRRARRDCLCRHHVRIRPQKPPASPRHFRPWRLTLGPTHCPPKEDPDTADHAGVIVLPHSPMPNFKGRHVSYQSPTLLITEELHHTRNAVMTRDHAQGKRHFLPLLPSFQARSAASEREQSQCTIHALSLARARSIVKLVTNSPGSRGNQPPQPSARSKDQPK